MKKHERVCVNTNFYNIYEELSVYMTWHMKSYVKRFTLLYFVASYSIFFFKKKNTNI